MTVHQVCKIKQIKCNLFEQEYKGDSDIVLQDCVLIQQ